MALDVALVKKDFPILDQLIHGHRLVYLDSASSSQKPAAVLDAMQQLYETTYANVHRGVYSIAEESTRLYEEARSKAVAFIGAGSNRELVFTKNVTEAINLVAYAWGRTNLDPGDAVLLSEMEHHANLVPWLQLKAERGIELRYLAVDGSGQLVLDDLERLVQGVKLVGLTLVSNVLGTLNPVAEVARVAHAAGALVLVDGAQYTPHFPTRVAELGCDFYGFTSHKMLGPTGIGCLWARESLLDAMPIFLGGGEMIRDVRLDGFIPNELPWKFEAGTPPIAEAVGLGAAVDYLTALGMADVRAHEMALTGYALETLKERHGDDITIYGPSDPAQRCGVLSFSYKDIHPHDISQVLDQAGVCVRAGHHCAKPLMRRLGVGATARASLYLYNDEADVDALSSALTSADRLFS
ncbi:MAG: SufS family cysteine desulfurase [Actinomycetota bacterium]|nr:SufS family cysteine desulfurase [Actinomycetota bacterium]